MGKKSKRKSKQARRSNTAPTTSLSTPTTSSAIPQSTPQPTEHWTSVYNNLADTEGTRETANQLRRIAQNNHADDDFLNRWKAATAADPLDLTGLHPNNIRTDPRQNPYFEPFRLRAFQMYFKLLEGKIGLQSDPDRRDLDFVTTDDRTFIENLPAATNFEPFFLVHCLLIHSVLLLIIDGKQVESMIDFYRAEALFFIEMELVQQDTSSMTALPAELLKDCEAFISEIFLTTRSHTVRLDQIEPEIRYRQNVDRMSHVPRTNKESRDRMDAFIEVFNHHHESKWGGERLLAFGSYIISMTKNVNGKRNEMSIVPRFPSNTDVLPAQKLFPVEKKDRKFIRKISETSISSETAVFVAFALLTRGSIAGLLDGRKADELVFYRRCVVCCENVSAEDRLEKLPSFPTSLFNSPGWAAHTVPLELGNSWVFGTVGEYLSCIQNEAESFLKEAVEKGKAMGNPSLLIPCDYCDGCHKSRGKAEALYQVCSRCKITHYCSEACQRSHWKVHKEFCRQKGEFKIGDKVFCVDPHGVKALHEEMTGLETPCVIVGEDDSNANTWKINLINGDECYVFPSNKLRAMEPSELRLHGLAES